MDEQQFEVLFCDLCGTSVPLQDLENGAGIRHAGKTIGPCCLAAIRPAPGVRAAAIPGASAGGESRILPVGLVLLAAVAGATIFLDHRIADEVEAMRLATVALSNTADGHGAQLRALTESAETLARREQVAGLTTRIAASETAQVEFQSATAATLDQQSKDLGALQRRIDELARSQPDHGPLLESLRRELRQQAVTLAELRALPRAPAEPPPALEPIPATPAPAGMAPNLAHHVQRLADPDPATRFEAVDELLRSKDPMVREHLLPLTKDPDTFVRRLVVEGLKEFRHGTCVEALLTALADPEEIVADTAWRSLKELTGQKIPFEATASRDARTRAQARWRDWWEKNKESFGT